RRAPRSASPSTTPPPSACPRTPRSPSTITSMSKAAPATQAPSTSPGAPSPLSPRRWRRPARWRSRHPPQRWAFGTTGVVDVPAGVTATSANNVNIKLYPDADGRVGQIEINDRQGARLGALTQGASGFAIRAGAGGARFAAVPIAISPQQLGRDQGFVRQVHSAQNVGRRIVTE